MYKTAMYAALAMMSFSSIYAEEPQVETTAEAAIAAASNKSSTSFWGDRRAKKQAPEKKEPTVSVAAEFLYWQPSVDGFSYAQTGFLDTAYIPSPASFTLSELQPGKGSNLTLPQSFDPGFRVTLSGTPNNGDWSFGARYLWFYGSSQGSTYTTAERTPFQTNVSLGELDLITLLYGLGDGFSPTKTRASWSQRYQVADLFFSRNYEVNKHLKLCPHLGARGTWQKKSFEIDYGYANPLALAENSYQQPPYDVRVRNQNDHWGVGALAGLNSSWHFDKYVSIYGGFSVAALWMRQTPSMQVDVTYIGEDPSAQAQPHLWNFMYPVTQARIANVDGQHADALKAMFEASLGLRIESDFSEGNYHVALQVGWEGQYWPNQILRLQPLDDSGFAWMSAPLLDYSLQGLTAKLEFCF